MTRRIARLWITLTITLLAGCSSEELLGAFVDDELGPDFREVIHQLVYTEWSVNADEVRLDFQYRYGLGLEDEEGIAPVEWRYGVVDRDGYAVVDFTFEQMREPEPEKDKIFVTGRRTRAMTFPLGALTAGEDYVFFFRLCYRGDILGEYLTPITAEEDFQLSAGVLPELPPEQVGEPLSCDLPLPPRRPSGPQLINGQ
ncbi:MAG: hypothetical protein ACE366_05630 [Bradymonadia bacterium]